MNKKLRQNGFTVVELMIAISVFSMVMLICSLAIVSIGRMYYKGVVINRTQDAGRQVLEDISQAVQFGIGSQVPAEFRRVGSLSHNNELGQGFVHQSLCLGTTRYTYINNRAVGTGDPTRQARRIFWRDSISASVACNPVNIVAIAPPATGVGMLGDMMRIPILDAQHSNGSWGLQVRIAFGEDPNGFTDATYESCKSVVSGGQFCAVSSLNTDIVRRL